jgi:starch synthase
MTRPPLKILFAVAEASPFAKVGGLADVGAALPRALARRGHEVALVLPGYPGLYRGKEACSIWTPLGRRLEKVVFCDHGTHERVAVYSAQHEQSFGRDLVYGYPDDDERFILFSKAVAAFAARSRPVPDVVHVNDWHTALVPQYAREGRFRDALARSAIVLTVHNLDYQGPLRPETKALIGLRSEPDGTLLGRGIACADAINTVSRRYCEEILTPEHGRGLDGLLRSRAEDLLGILNGVDYAVFDPSVDPYIVARYDGSALERKGLNKLALQERSSLKRDVDVPLLSMVARLVDQKGLDLVCSSLDRIVQLGAQAVVVGAGDGRYEKALAAAAARHPGAIAYRRDSGESAARLVYAGADLFLAPSRFEPCGLGPLIALRYGTIPVVRRTGGLAETISDYRVDPGTGLGFTFVAKYREHLMQAVRAALALYGQPRRWERLQRRAMAADFSWEVAAAEYEELYLYALQRRRARSRARAKQPSQDEVVT